MKQDCDIRLRFGILAPCHRATPHRSHRELRIYANLRTFDKPCPTTRRSREAVSEALRIERREYKYLADEALVDRVRHAIRPFCALDPYAVKAPQNRYTIESLYLDTPDLALYRANDVELVDRFKLRVRHYPDAPQSPVFLEMKSRYHDTIVKSRGLVGRDWAPLVNDPFVAKSALGTAPAVERFVTNSHMIGARPTVLVRYTREAWASLVDDYARVTFDRQITGTLVAPDAWHFDADLRDYRAADDPTGVRDCESLVIIELKFTARVPSWMLSLIETLGLVRRSYSKYGRVLESLYLPADLRTPRRAWLSGESAPRGDRRAARSRIPEGRA